jgi:Glycosyl hydrolases family 15
LTLKGLIYAPTGAMLAAATTSLPETPGGERNYDYRYSWLRDSTFLLWGLYTLGLDREAIDYFYFLTDLADEDPDLQIMYGIGGERELTEQILDHLSGYDGARPVRIGNAAWDQRQRDVGGAARRGVPARPLGRRARRAALVDTRATGGRFAGAPVRTRPGIWEVARPAAGVQPSWSAAAASGSSGATRIGTSAFWISPDETEPRSADRAAPRPRVPTAMTDAP